MFNMFGSMGGGLARRSGGSAMAPSLVGGLSRGPMNQQMPGMGGGFNMFRPQIPRPRGPMMNNPMPQPVMDKGFQTPPMLGGPSMGLMEQLFKSPAGSNRMAPHVEPRDRNIPMNQLY